MKQQFNNKKAALLLGALISINAFAQNNSPIVLASAASPLNPIIVTATRTPTKASDVLADNVYIGPEEIEQAGQTS